MQRIAELRKSAGEKQEQLAAVLGCNRASLANYEKNSKRTPDAEIIIKIAQHYETTADYVLGMTDKGE